MLNITAIELEGFQSIERRTRIDLKPITLLYGPNSAGKSAIFDALELLRIILDPLVFDEQTAADMVNRWARRPGHGAWREMTLAIEFPFIFQEVINVWGEASNWKEGRIKSDSSSFNLGEDDLYEHDFEGKNVRIELTLKIINQLEKTVCFVSEFQCSLEGQRFLSLSKDNPIEDYPEERAFIDSNMDQGGRWLIAEDKYNFVGLDLKDVLRGIPDEKKRRNVCTIKDGLFTLQTRVMSRSLSPMQLMADAIFEFEAPPSVPLQICLNAKDIFFYFGTLLWGPLRNNPPLVTSDRRAPRPVEALALVDLGFSGWWTDSIHLSGPASLLKNTFKSVDPHFQGMAEAAHAEYLLRTASHFGWGDDAASTRLAPAKVRAEAVTRINHHLERSLFKEKLYQLGCSSTLMVPIDLDLDDPQGYYLLAQPAVVRLFLKEPSGQTVELEDVGSGVPFVLPVLYAISFQGFVKIQQPELHLHPALQCSVADVFVEELHRPGCGQFLIETHSEHLLLRLLRRIRDTEKGKSLSDDVKLTHDQIAVYYFDPQVGGETFVSRQLITPLGDFYNDWPRGFFAERDSDLFEK